MKRKFEKDIRDICSWLLQQVKQAGAGGAVVHIDGGLDSAVTAALAKKALKKNVLGVIMPCQGLPEDIEHAKLVVEHLRLAHEVVDLNESYLHLLRVLPNANIRTDGAIIARLRMTVLHRYAELRNCKVLGTINRSDWELGRYTEYGENAADLFPILHLYASRLRDIARSLKLPGRILEGPRWAGGSGFVKLEPDMALDYKELDAYLQGYGDSLPDHIKAKLQEMQQTATLKKSSFSYPSLLSGAEAVDADGEDHEAYGKSIEALTLISKAITSDQYLEDILRLIVMVTAEVMSSSVCSLWLLDEKERVLRLRATQSIDSEYLKDRVLKVGEGVVGKVVAENQPYVVPNVLNDPFFKEKELAKRMRLVSMLSMPMRVTDRVIGVINCYTSHPHVFSDLQMNVLTSVANQAAIAIEKTELMVRSSVIQEELEKRKLIERAKDLLMKRLNFSGEDAYRWLQKRSMDTRKSMREVSEAVLLTMEG